MPERTALAQRFTRAIHLQRDFRDLRYRLDGYQITPLVRQLAGRIVAGLAQTSNERAFSVVGPFGSGKSAFGVFVAHYLQRGVESRQQLFDSLDADFDAHLPLQAPTLRAVLVAGNNSSLRQAVLASLLHNLENQHAHGFGELRNKILSAAEDPQVAPNLVAELVAEAAKRFREQGQYQGLVLVVDELGQYLDYAARQDEERDLFVLQSLAEMAARSGATPVLVVTILHQAFERYALYAGSTQRIEWAKVQGRFADLPFQEPASQMIRMVALALRPGGADPLADVRAEWAARLAPQSEELGLRPSEIGSAEWQRIIADSYPIHPTVLIALPSLFRQLAQNERSLFAFLHSDEPWGLRDVQEQVRRGEHKPIYRLPDLYNYVATNLGSGLFGQARGQRWAELAEARSLLVTAEPSLLNALTTIGTIGALERSSGLRASKTQILFTLSDSQSDPEIEQAIDALYDRRMIVFRLYRDAYVLWEGSDIDLDGLAQQARQELQDTLSLPKLLQSHADTTPRIARRHSYRYGATRTFAMRYVELDQLAQPLPIGPGYDGELLHVVPADEEELQQAERWAKQESRDTEQNRIVVLPRRVRELRGLLLDVAALNNLLDTRTELEQDRPARREVAGRLIEAQQALTQVIGETYGGQYSRWFYRQQAQPVETARQIDELLSRAADSTYSQTPRVWNELIVRRQLSAAGAKARRNLVEAMLAHSDEERLGIVGYPPERAIYESVLHAGKIHRRDEDGVWRIGMPPADDPLQLRPAWGEMERFLQAEAAEAQPLTKLFAALESPPFGVKSGLIPLLFMTLYVARAGEINIYERGNYVPTPDIATFERLLARPDYFAVRLSSAEGSRRLVYERIANALAPRALSQPVQPALLAVAMPLLRIQRSLSPFGKQTRKISPQAQRIREALREARSPDELLFERLPQACDLPIFAINQPEDDAAVDRFTNALRNGLQELQDAYPRLIDQLTEYILAAFALPNAQSGHSELQARYARIDGSTNDRQLRALGIRLETADPGGSAWVESIAALLNKRPPEHWNDEDLPAFQVAIADLGRRFRTAEELALVARTVPAEAPLLRVGLANGQGELSRVLHITENDMAVDQLHADLANVLGRHSALSDEQRAAAVAALLQTLLSQADQPAS